MPGSRVIGQVDSRKASLFKSNLNIYEVHNNGAWYNFGYLFGLACFFGGTGSRAARRSEPRQ